MAAAFVDLTADSDAGSEASDREDVADGLSQEERAVRARERSPSPARSESPELRDRRMDPDSDPEEERRGGEDLGSGTDDDAKVGEPVVADGKFDLQCRRVFLTYSQCNPLSPDVLREFFLGLPNPPYSFIIGSEEHQDGGKHFHCLLKWNTARRLHVRNARYFDVSVGASVFHPNIRRLKTDRDLKRARHYVSKAGDVLEHQWFDYLDSTNYVKRKGDFTAWQADSAMVYAPKIRWPVLNIDGTQIQAPSDANKCRHYIICGPPDAGKTRWFRATFRSRQAYFAADGKYPFDNYAGQQVIVFDDVPTTRNTVVKLCDPHPDAGEALPGDQRYSSKFFKPKLALLVIVICNQLPDWEALPECRARFNLINLAADFKWQP